MDFQPHRLREAREALTDRGRRVTQDRFAELVGVSKRSPGRWENGESEPRMVQLTRISEVTGRSIGFFFGEPELTDPLDQARSQIADALTQIGEGFDELADVVETLNEEARTAAARQKAAA